jgi:hypothetical protein
MCHDLWVSDDLQEIGLELVQWNVLLVGRIWQRGVVGAKEDGLNN